MAQGKLEKDVEQPFADWIDEYYPQWICIKINWRGRKGFPDRLLLGEGEKILFIEFKKPGKDLEPLQHYWKRILESMGYTVYVCDSLQVTKDKFRTFIQTG